MASQILANHLAPGGGKVVVLYKSGSAAVVNLTLANLAANLTLLVSKKIKYLRPILVLSTQSTFTLLARLWQHISARRRGQLGLLVLLMVLASFAEIVSIGAVLPFLGALTAPDRIFALPVAQPFINALGLTEPQELLLPLTVIFIFGALLSGFMRLVLLWMQTRLSHAIGADLSINIYRRTLYQPYAVHVARNSSEVIA